MKKNWYPFHLSYTTVGFLYCLVGCLDGSVEWKNLLPWGVAVVIFINLWAWRVVQENLDGYQTGVENKAYLVGFFLFLVSEAVLFGSFFVSYGYFTINPSVWMGAEWGAIGTVYTHLGIPLLNTVLLVSSGLFATHSLHQIYLNNRQDTLISLTISIVLGFAFLLLQYHEYKTLPFDIATSTFGSLFYLLTGFHGAHVIFGLCLLSAAWWRLYKKYVYFDDWLGVETAVLYWHFVDIIRLFSYIMVYLWS